MGCCPDFTPIYLGPFCRAEFGFKEGDFSVTEFADFAEPAGHTSIAIPFQNDLGDPTA